ncbi:MAG: putative signal transducing protein [Paludibacteraceae bacterium]
MKTIILTSCDNVVTANLIKGNLANEGIECFFTNENYTSLYPNMNGAMGSGIQIFVNEDDVEHALKVINSNNRSVYCSKCNSENVTQQVQKNMLKVVGIMILSLFSSSAFGNIKSKYHCNKCGNDFEI